MHTPVVRPFDVKIPSCEHESTDQSCKDVDTLDTRTHCTNLTCAVNAFLIRSDTCAFAASLSWSREDGRCYEESICTGVMAWNRCERTCVVGLQRGRQADLVPWLELQDPSHRRRLVLHLCPSRSQSLSFSERSSLRECRILGTPWEEGRGAIFQPNSLQIL